MSRARRPGQDGQKLVKGIVLVIGIRKSSTEARRSKAITDAEKEEEKDSLLAKILHKFSG